MPKPIKFISNRVGYWMDKQGWTQAELIEKLKERGIDRTRQTLSAWNRGHWQPSQKAVDALMNIFALEYEADLVERVN